MIIQESVANAHELMTLHDEALRFYDELEDHFIISMQGI